MTITIGYHSEDTGSTLYALLLDASNQLYNVVFSDFEAFSGTLDNYDLPLVEGEARYYEASFSGTFATGQYIVRVYEQAGGTPDLSTDELLTVRSILFDFSAEKEITLEQLYERLETLFDGSFSDADRDLLKAIHGQARLRVR